MNRTLAALLISYPLLAHPAGAAETLREMLVIWGHEVSVAHDGRVVTCPVDLDARFVAGDVTRETLASVWNGKLRSDSERHSSGSSTRLTWMFGATPTGSPCSMHASYSRRNTGMSGSAWGAGMSE